jgi:ABC-type antimicrobial peptide transport system ATPase subunit
MYLYNVTINIDESVAAEWVAWMKEVHIPEVVATGCFTEGRLCRIIGESQGGKSFAAQYLCPDLSTYHRYQTKFAADLQAKTKAKYEGKFAAFRTVMEIL